MNCLQFPLFNLYLNRKLHKDGYSAGRSHPPPLHRFETIKNISYMAIILNLKKSQLLLVESGLLPGLPPWTPTMALPWTHWGIEDSPDPSVYYCGNPFWNSWIRHCYIYSLVFTYKQGLFRYLWKFILSNKCQVFYAIYFKHLIDKYSIETYHSIVKDIDEGRLCCMVFCDLIVQSVW
jgi:hypothetical protein